MIEISAGLDESSLIRAVRETGWYPEGLLKGKEWHREILGNYIDENLIYGGMNDLPSFRNQADGLWQVYVPASYEAALRELGGDFAHQFFTRSIQVGNSVHHPFTRYGEVGGSHLGFRVLPQGNIQVRSSLEQFRETKGTSQPSLEVQWGLRNNRPGTQFLLESVLRGRSDGSAHKLFTERKGMGGSGRRTIPGIKDVVATYSHDKESGPDAVIQLALPDPELRSRLIQHFKDLTSLGVM